MSLFGKKKDKRNNIDDQIAMIDENDQVFFEELFGDETDLQASDLDMSDDELNSILDEYLAKEEINIDVDSQDASETIPEAKDEDVFFEEASDEGAEPALEAFEEIDLISELDDTVAPEIEPVCEKAEPTADEAIEEFMKNISEGGSIAELLGDVENVSEDGLEIPAFAGNTFSETDASAEAVSPVELAVPENIEDMEFNTAETVTVGSTDMNLRIAFGLEEEEDDPDVMKDAVKKMGDHFESDRRLGKKYTPDHHEFTDAMQARDIAGEYKVRRRNSAVRLFFAAVFALLLLVFENITTITGLITGSPKQFAGVIDPAVYPVVYIMVSLQLLFICALFALPELTKGVKRLFTGAPTPDSITAFAVFMATLASGVSAYFVSANNVPKVYNAVPAVLVVMTLVYSRINIKREMLTFFVAGSKKTKYAMNRVPDNETLLPPDSYDDEVYGDVMRVEKTGFVDGFFSRICVPDAMTSGFSGGLIGVAVAAAILFGIFASGDKTPVSVCESVYLVLLALLPFSAYITFSYPFYRTCKTASECECAIVGETSLEEYAAAAVVSFDDGNIFPSYGVKVQNIKIYNNARIDRVLYYASSAFKYAGGPLSDVFEVATMEMGRSDNVQITDADKGYLCATVDGVGIVFGTYPALIERGFDISDSIALDDVDFSDELSIMYMFREGMLIAKFYIKYVLDGDIESIVRQFQDYGMYLCVRTYDPNIDEDMVCAKLSVKNPPVKVVRYRNADDARGAVERIDSGFVTYGSPKALLQLLPYCDKTIHTKRTCGALTIMSVILALMFLAISSMSEGLGVMNSLFITVYHVVWTLFTYVASKLFIR